MKSLLLTTQLLAATLLLGISGCFEKQVEAFSGTFSGTASVAYGTSAQQDFHFTDGGFTDVHR